MSQIIDLRDGESFSSSPGFRLASLERQAASPKWVGWRIFAIDLAAVVFAALATIKLVGPSWSELAVLAAWPVVLTRVGAFNIGAILRGAWSPKRVWAAMARLLVLLAMLSLVLPTTVTGPAILLVALLGLTTTAGRSWVGLWLSDRHCEDQLVMGVLARGTEDDLIEFADMLDRDRAQPFRVVAAQLTEGEWTRPFGGTVIPRGVDPVDSAVRNNLGVVAFLGRQPEDSIDLRRMVWRMEAEGLDARMIPILAPLAAPEVDALGGTGLPTLAFRGRDLRAETGFHKVVLDKILAAIGLLIISPLLVAIAIAIKVTSPGPVLFRQTRIGRDRRQFTMLKFRTMVVDAEARLAELEALNKHQGGTLFKIDKDPRITRVGGFLRRFSLDELPQLFNVVRGEMSLVGPRPPLPREVAQYPVDAHRRFRVRPGLTGLWQVSGRSDLDPVESARLDTHYVEHWSPGLDVQILARTVKAVISADGAY